MVSRIPGEIKRNFHLETFVVSIQGPREGNYATFRPIYGCRVDRLKVTGSLIASYRNLEFDIRARSALIVQSVQPGITWLCSGI